MSLMASSEERTAKDIFEDAFSDFKEPVENGESVTTIVAEHEQLMMSRLKRVSSVVMNQEVGEVKYTMDVAVPHDRHLDIAIVYSSDWVIPANEVRSDTPSVQSKSVSQFATFNPTARKSFEKPEHIFIAYDRAKKLEMRGQLSKVPDIRTLEGVKEFMAGVAQLRKFDADDTKPRGVK